MNTGRYCLALSAAILLLLAASILSPPGSLAGTVSLKNGRTVESAAAWEKDGPARAEHCGQTAGYPKEQAAAASNGTAQIGFALDLWALGMGKKEVFQVAEAHDKPLLPAHHIAVAAHFDRALVEKYADTENQYYFKEALFGRRGRVSLDFSPQTHRLASIQYAAMMANLEEKTRFCGDAEAFFTKRFGKAVQRGGTSSMHRELFWRAGSARVVELVAGPTVRITYKAYEAPAPASSQPIRFRDG